MIRAAETPQNKALEAGPGCHASCVVIGFKFLGFDSFSAPKSSHLILWCQQNLVANRICVYYVCIGVGYPPICMVFLARFPLKKLGWHLPFLFIRLIETLAKLLPAFRKKKRIWWLNGGNIQKTQHKCCSCEHLQLIICQLKLKCIHKKSTAY